uniref:TPR_REGION domain-containing protein n=1 Tax=Bursaphelenchus xylophilus TaxID=6326 RepID=A0A1I7RJA8_BURXY
MLGWELRTSTLATINKHLEARPFHLEREHLRIAANDAADVKLCPRYVLKFHIAHCFDLFGELIRAKQEYKRILDEYGKQSDEKTLPADIHSAVLRQSGWVSYRQSLSCAIEEKPKLINEAEMFLSSAVEVAKAAGLRHLAGQAQSFLGRILSEQPSKEERAFDNLRAYIDCGGGDANTWYCIGELYSKKGQPKDALQAFACSVALDPTHISSWVSVGQLYESHKLFKFALDCYKEAVKQSNLEGLCDPK